LFTSGRPAQALDTIARFDGHIAKDVTVLVRQGESRMLDGMREHVDQILADACMFYQGHGVNIDFQKVANTSRPVTGSRVGLELLSSDEFLFTAYPPPVMDKEEVRSITDKIFEEMRVDRDIKKNWYEQGFLSLEWHAKQTDGQLMRMAEKSARLNLTVNHYRGNPHLNPEPDVELEKGILQAMSDNGRVSRDNRDIYINLDGFVTYDWINKCLGSKELFKRFGENNVRYSFEDLRYRYAMRQTIAHELGHALGLIHTEEGLGESHIGSGDDHVVNLMSMLTETCPTEKHPYGFGLCKDQVDWMHNFLGRGDVYKVWLDNEMDMVRAYQIIKGTQ